MTSQKSILDIALALAHVNPNKNDFSDLLSCISEWIHCDAVALLIKQGETLKPVAQRGLSQDALR